MRGVVVVGIVSNSTDFRQLFSASLFEGTVVAGGQHLGADAAATSTTALMGHERFSSVAAFKLIPERPSLKARAAVSKYRYGLDLCSHLNALLDHEPTFT